ncbi:MAG: CPBP family intramembrane metalloprotease [Clostridia bacterium]|nr:CPBP family intramembrane metalloprotease [Clostridia bacterium]
MLDIRRGRRDIGFIALAIAFIFLFTIAIQIFVSIAVVQFAPWMFDDAFWSWAISSVPMYAVAMPLSIFFFRRCREVKRPERQRIGGLKFWGILSICFVGVYVCNIIGTAANEAFSALLGREAINEIEQVTMSSPWWVNLIFTVLLAPVFEELFLRKLVIDRLLPYGELPAILLSGIAFGLIHGNFNQFFYAAAVGMIFGLVYTRTGNILYSIVMHMILNLVGGVYAAEAQKLMEGASWGGIFASIPSEIIGIVMMAIYMLALLAALVGAIIAFLSYRKEFWPLRQGIYTVTAREWVQMLVINPSVWVFLAVCALMFVI